MELVGIVLSEISHEEKVKWQLKSLNCGELKKMKNSEGTRQ